MPRLVILGSSAAVADETHENAYMVVEGEQGAILIDCNGRTLVHLKRAGVDPDKLQDMILTHFHPDHVSGVPRLLMSSWLLGREAPLRLYGLHHCMQRVADMMDAFHWDTWPKFFPVVFHHIPQREEILVLENDDFIVTASPVKHYVPTMALRIESKETGYVLAYSSDTIPCAEMVRLSYDADLLIHEAAGAEPLGHSSAAQAGAIAQEAGVKSLGLIHYKVWGHDPTPLVAEAKTTFEGHVFLCEDFQEIDMMP